MNCKTLCAVALATVSLVPGLVKADDVDFKKPQPVATNRSPLAISGPGSERVIDFSVWQSSVPTNEIVGQISSGLFCGDPQPLHYSKNLDSWFSAQVVKSFKSLATKQGYTLQDTARSVFDDKSKNSADFRIGVTLLALDYRTCLNAAVAKAASTPR